MGNPIRPIGGLRPMGAKPTTKSPAPAAVKSGQQAGKIVGDVCGKLGGKGGGKPDFAMGGGKDIAKLAEVLK